MSWFLLSLVTALTQAVKDAILKHSLARVDVGPAILAYTAGAAAFLWLGAAASPGPVLGPAFWSTLALAGLLGALTFFLYGQALKHGDLSLSLPMLAFTPLFMLVTSPLILGEFPEPAGIAGIACVVAGSYVLNLRERKKGAFAPFAALVTNPGARCMLLVSFVWSIGANLDKIGLGASSPIFWAASAYTASALALLPGVWIRNRGRLGRMRAAPWALLSTGLLEAVGLACQMHALPLTLAAYVIAVKRLSIIFGVLLGAAALGEPDLRHRLPGALLMVAGVFFIAVFG